HYTLQALARAWRFGQASLPDTFVFRVSRARARRPIQGRLASFFDVHAFLVPSNPDADADDAAASEQLVELASLVADDLVEVRLKSVDPSAPLVLVKPVRKLDRSG
ncbi:hypothetical protein MAPG_02698, partial [Magnaporthiopsis poae ATCC 64411]